MIGTGPLCQSVALLLAAVRGWLATLGDGTAVAEPPLGPAATCRVRQVESDLFRIDSGTQPLADQVCRARRAHTGERWKPGYLAPVDSLPPRCGFLFTSRTGPDPNCVVAANGLRGRSELWTRAAAFPLSATLGRPGGSAVCTLAYPARTPTAEDRKSVV